MILSLIVLVVLALSVIQVIRHPGEITSYAVLGISVALPLFFIFTRSFPLKVQDRAIRAEETLRYYILTGKQLSPDLSIGQICALRFASDEEFLALCDRAVQEHLTPDAIKRSVKNWQADHHRA